MNQKTALFLLLILFAITIFCHEWAEVPFEWYVKNYGNKSLKNVLNVVFTLLTAGGTVFLIRKLHQHPDKKVLFTYLVITLGFSFLGYRFLMPYKSEAIHFLQFGLLGFVCMYWVANIWFALNLVSFLGIFDEIYQYIGSYSGYLDWNDMVLNFFGVALGVVVFKIWNPDKRTILKGIQKHFGLVLVYSFVGAVILLLFSEVVCVYANDVCGRSIIRSSKGDISEDFFVSTNFGPDWHRVKPYEGMIYVLLMPLLYYPLSRRLDR
jgi:hypothetical protein